MRCADMCWPRVTWYASSRSLRRRLVSGWREAGNHACWNYFCFTRLDAAADPCLGRKILRRRCADHPLIVTVICRFFRRGLTVRSAFLFLWQSPQIATPPSGGCGSSAIEVATEKWRDRCLETNPRTIRRRSSSSSRSILKMPRALLSTLCCGIALSRRKSAI